MNPTPENPGGSPERVLIDKIKEAVKVSGVLVMDEGEDRIAAANEVLEATGINGVSDLKDLLAARNNKNVNQQGIDRKIDQLGIAIGESVEEMGSPEMKQAIKAGSFSTEKILPEAWRIVVEGDERDQSLARIIVDGAIESKVSNKARRDAISNEIESVDYYVNNSDYGLLEGQIEASITKLNSIKSPLNKREMDFISEKIAYLQGLRSSSVNDRNGDALSGAVNRMTEVAEKMTETAEKISSVAGSTTSRESNEVRVGRRPKYSPEGKFEGYESDYELKKNNFADALKDMQDAYSIRWNDYLTTSWYENLSKDEKGMVSLMAMISGIAGNLKNEKDLERILGSKETFSFISEHMNVLFNHDFKMVMSKMLNDLGEIYTDDNGHRCFRYKEIEGKDGVGRDLHPDVKYRIEHIRDYEEQLAYFLAECNGRWAVYENDEKGVDGNILHKRGEYIMEDGKRVPDWLDRSMAYTAWNMFFGFGDSSVADRLRILPTLGGIISDQIRTLDPKAKADGKWGIIVKGVPVDNIEASLKKAELFGGKLAKGVVERMKLEYRYGVANGKGGEYPIDGRKTLRQKIIDGNVKFMSHKMFYGFLDFVNGGRDLYKVGPDGKTLIENGKEVGFYTRKEGGNKVTLSTLLYDYAFKEEVDGGKVAKDEFGSVKRSERTEEEIKSRDDFNFGSGQVTFMNEYRDSMEGAILSYMNLTGKADIKDPKDWIMKFIDKLGMINGIAFNGREAFSYSSDPLFWRDVLIGAYGYDESRLSTDYFCLKRPDPKPGETQTPYNLYLYDLLTKDFGFSNFDFNLNELMRLLGVPVDNRQAADGPWVTTKSVAKEKDDRNFTRAFKDLLRKAESRRSRLPTEKSITLADLSVRAKGLMGSSYEFKRVKESFERAVTRGILDMANDLYAELVALSD